MQSVCTALANSFLALLLVVLSSTPALSQTMRGSHPRPLAFTRVTVIDMTGAPPMPDMTVVVVGSRIKALGRTGRVRVPRGARLIDASGKYLIPGLWDMHAHVDDTGDYYFPLALANGITGLRDMGSHIDRLRQWRELRARGAVMPRIVAAGPIVTGMVADEDPRLVRVSGRAQAERAVDSLVARGADFIKVFDYLSREAYLAIVRRAARRRVPVAGHLPASVDAAAASRLGQRSIEHTGSALGGLLLDCSTREDALKRELRERVRPPVDVPKVMAWAGDPARLRVLAETYDPAKAERLARIFALHGTWMTPTIHTFSRLNLLPPDESAARDPRLKYMPASVRGFAQSYVNDYKAQPPSPEAVEARAGYYAAHLKLYRTMKRAGVRFLAGSDAVPFPPYLPAFGLHDELERFVEAGFTPFEALQTATANPALFLGRQGSLGTVERGKVADLVLLEANPLENIGNTRRIAAVVVGGRYLSKEDLQKMLDEVEAAVSKK